MEIISSEFIFYLDLPAIIFNLNKNMKKVILTTILALGGILNSSAQCKVVTSINENFDSWKDIDKCWNAESGKAMLYLNDGKITFYSMSNPQEKMYLTTPKIKAGTYKLTFDISKNDGNATYELFTIGNVSDQKSYVSISKPTEITGDKKSFTITLKTDSHLGLKVLLTGIHQAVYLDNFSLTQK